MIARLKNESGFALILTLVVTALMVAVVVEMIHQVYVDTSLSRGFRDGQQASILAESGVEGVVKLMPSFISANPTTSLSDVWAKPIKLDDEAGSLTVTITEESGKININDLVDPIGTDNVDTKNALSRLGKFLTPQLPETIWPPVADWIRPPGSATHSGVAPSYYGAHNPPYKARNAPLLTLTELSLIKGISPDIPRKLTPYLRTFSESVSTIRSKVNINTAPKEVLQALDNVIDARTAETIIEKRNIKAFDGIGDVNARVPETGQSQNLVNVISVKGNVFRITAVATVKDSIRTVEAVVQPGTAGLSNTIPIGFLSWQEY
jgi:general secretion pathway protein K